MKSKVSDEKFKLCVETSFSIKEALEKMGLNATGSSQKHFKLRAFKNSIDYSHFSGRKRTNNRKGKKQKTLVEILTNNSEYNIGKNIKNQLIVKNLLINCCYICLIPPIWQSANLTLQLDHIDGNRKNNTIENLRFLCPNCHTQTSTHSRKKVKVNGALGEYRSLEPSVEAKNFSIKLPAL